MVKKRRYFSATQKVSILRQHLIEKIPVSDICDELEISTTQFYKWQTEFFENGSKAFSQDTDKELKKSSKKNSLLQADMVHKNGVIAELVGENLRLKKKNGLI